ncbi:DUF3793 family protein [Ruminococcus gauvreauii]|uniref:DUF3793 family protein n=1 Tax=Ruminococcus gauvreauii TaxID=438033 RepID=A0ABY5VEY3_9FIRM|nr:DUF3793 family protein [Ruminococcus gauvreauii]UWP58922.1 DUF3793 family protein [Ruminococcus gauvreauii]
MHNWMQESIEIQIARQCAPVLAGVKPSNILILKDGNIAEIARMLEGTPVGCRLLSDGAGNSVWLLYRRESLEKILSDKPKMEFLRCFGYRYRDVEEALWLLGRRFQSYKQKSMEFPHEMGIFLGYPLGDVKGFIRHRGRDFLYCGYWKVYENEAEARKLFSVYTSVKQQMLKELYQGKHVWQMIPNHAVIAV